MDYLTCQMQMASITLKGHMFKYLVGNHSRVLCCPRSPLTLHSESGDGWGPSLQQQGPPQHAARRLVEDCSQNNQHRLLQMAGSNLRLLIGASKVFFNCGPSLRHAMLA